MEMQVFGGVAVSDASFYASFPCRNSHAKSLRKQSANSDQFCRLAMPKLTNIPWFVFRGKLTPVCAKIIPAAVEAGVGFSGDAVLHGGDFLEEENSLNTVLVELRNGGGPADGKIVFPSTMSARQRRRAHEVAERLGLGHVSMGQGNQRCFSTWRLSVAERLSRLRKLLDVEEAASREKFMIDQPLQSWRVLEAQGILLHNAIITEKEAASFGRERWVLEDGIGVERSGHVARFSQRARPGMPVCLAEKDLSGNWAAVKEQPPGRVGWRRGNKICVVFDHPPSYSEQVNEADILLVPDSSSFERMGSVLRVCEQGENGLGILLDVLLGSATGSMSLRTTGKRHVDAEPSVLPDTIYKKEFQLEQLFDKGLNSEQCAAVKLCTEANRSPVVLIHGPFGTGKTRTLVEVVQQQVKAGRRVLVCAASNAAVDNMVHALLASEPTLPLARAGLTERVSASLAAHTLEALQDAQPEAAIARRLRKEAYSMQLTAEKWTRASTGGEKRRNARKEVNTLFKDARRLDNMCAASVLQRTKILCGTLTGFASALKELGDGEETRFDCAVIDEASQAITPALLLVLPYLKYSENRADLTNSTMSAKVPIFVMAGDHQQLPPTVLSEDLDNKSGGLGATLFEELMERDGGGLGTRIKSLLSVGEHWQLAKHSILQNAHALVSSVEDCSQPSESMQRFVAGGISVALRQQYRMPPQLMAFPSSAFYGAGLIARQSHFPILEPVNEISMLQSGLVLEVIDTAGAGWEEERIGDTVSSSVKSNIDVEIFSTSNPGQATLTAQLVRELLQSATTYATNVGVVTPYSAQVMLLRQLMAGEVEAGLEIDSIDAFQGREKEIIVMDAVRSNTNGTIGFLGDFHRLNVAITRARKKLVIIGDSATLSIDPVWAVFFEWVSDYRDKPLSGIRYQSVFELPTDGGW